MGIRYIFNENVILGRHNIISNSKFNYMITKKYIIATGLVTAMLGSALMVTAQEPPSSAAVLANQKMVLEIGPGGRTLIRGTVSAVNNASITVKSWGGDWAVVVASDTKLMPGSDMSQFQVGDFIGAQGTVSTTAAWTINANLVRNWTGRQTINDNKQEIKGIIKEISAKNWEGIVVGDINGDGSFKLNVNGTTYDIKMATGAKVVDKNYMTLSPSQIKAGDTVRVYGPAVDTTITASVVRNTSWDLKKGTK